VFARLLALTVAFAGPACLAERNEPPKVAIAAAANLVYVLDALNAAYARTAPGTAVTVATGASGSLFAQIGNGAPFDVFLSADTDYPRRLVEAHQADAGSLRTFAVGRMVLWTTNPRLELATVADAVRDPAVKKIAIANPQTAPYGRAAREALEKLGCWTQVQSKLVMGESISQTAQFVETGNADLGFVALSIVLSPQLKERGRWIEVPASLHAPLDHAAVLTNRGAQNPEARRYLEFLRSEPAQKILREFGYEAAR
jgi:molybdate transport system substrate-binding protein